jgi:manganese efflux pump family protein
VPALLLLAVALGLSNFAAAIGIGVSGVRGRTMVRIAVVFGLFEAGMPVLGLVLGHGLAASLGAAARWLGGAVLIAVGVLSLIMARRGGAPGHLAASGAAGAVGAVSASGAVGAVGAVGASGASGVAGPSGTGAPGRAGAGRAGQPWRTGRVAATGLALSVDNLAAGFALGSYHSGLAVAVIVFGIVSVAMTLAGLELGAKIGTAAGDRSELVASVLLIGVGVAIAAGAI